MSHEEEQKRIDEMTKVFDQIFSDFATKYGSPVGDLIEQTFDYLAEKTEQKRIKKWGSMPEEYDPANDPSHPMHGFRLELEKPEEFDFNDEDN